MAITDPKPTSLPFGYADPPERAADALSCPFCTDRDALYFYYNGAGPPASYSVQCDNCGARGPSGLGHNWDTSHESAKLRAILEWNAAPRRKGGCG